MCHKYHNVSIAGELTKIGTIDLHQHFSWTFQTYATESIHAETNIRRIQGTQSGKEYKRIDVIGHHQQDMIEV